MLPLCFYGVAKWKIGVEAEQESLLGCIAPKWVVFVCTGVEIQSLYSSLRSSSWVIFWPWSGPIPMVARQILEYPGCQPCSQVSLQQPPGMLHPVLKWNHRASCHQEVAQETCWIVSLICSRLTKTEDQMNEAAWEVRETCMLVLLYGSQVLTVVSTFKYSGGPKYTTCRKSFIHIPCGCTLILPGS